MVWFKVTIGQEVWETQVFHIEAKDETEAIREAWGGEHEPIEEDQHLGGTVESYAEPMEEQ